jgi:hypothetical protein
MTQTEIIPTSQVTAALLRESDLNEIRVARPDGKVYGEDLPSLAFGLGSYEGDYEGFAEYLRSLV